MTRRGRLACVQYNRTQDCQELLEFTDNTRNRSQSPRQQSL